MASQPEWLTLEPGEDLVWTGHPRLRRVLRRVGTGAAWSAAAIAGAWVVTGYLGIDLGIPTTYVWLAVAGFVLLQVANVAWYYLVTRNVEYVLTTENVYKKTGVASETVTTVGLGKIQNLELSQDVTGNLFDYGTVAISTAGSEGVEMTVDDLDDPDEFRRELRERASRAERREAVTDADVPTGPDAETLEGMVEEARLMRESAERIQRQFS